MTFIFKFSLKSCHNGNKKPLYSIPRMCKEVRI